MKDIMFSVCIVNKAPVLYSVVLVPGRASGQ